MGSEHFYPEEAPLRQVRVDGFWIDAAPVTNSDFARFVAETGHVTAAEIAPDPRAYPGPLPGMDRAGLLGFRTTAGTGELGHPGKTWPSELWANRGNQPS